MEAWGMSVPKNSVFTVVKGNIVKVLDLNPDQISIDKSLSDLGANSVDRMEIVTCSMEDLGLDIPLMSFAKVSNIEGLVEVFASHLR